MRYRRVVILLIATTASLAAAFVLFCAVDSQAIPKTVDAVRAVVGDHAILVLEDKVFRAKNWMDERAYASQVEQGLVEAHPESVQEVLAPPVAAAEVSAPAVSEARPVAMPAEPAGPQPVELGSDADDEQAGRWIDKGDFLRTHVYPEPKMRSVADVAWIKPGARLHVICGTGEPARGSGVIPKGELQDAFLAFSGGFQYRHFPGGIMCHGEVLRPMRPNLGTLVVFKDGMIKIGKWTRDWQQVTPIMSDVRQALLLVDGGTFNEDVNYNAYALHRAVRVYRSALGITKDRDLVYAAGNNLSAQGLADSLIACGVVSAIHLDMNYGNATCGVLTGAGDARTIQPLTTRFPEPSRFLGANHRDFMYLTRGDSAGEALEL